MSETDGDVPSLTRQGARATITLRRPARHNRLEIADLVALDRIIAGIETDPTIRVLVLTATGPSFSSGFDVNALTGPTPPPLRFDQVVDRLAGLAVPSLCALNGPVYGGSADLALACDLRIGVEGMKLMVPAARIGMLYYPSGLSRFVAKLGLAAAKRIFMLAETIEAPELLRLGFLDRLVPAAELAPATDAMAETLAGLAPRALAGIKRTLDAAALGTLDRAEAQAAYLASFGSAELAEGLAALAAKRKPVFS